MIASQETQKDGTQKTQIVDASGNIQPVLVAGSPQTFADVTANSKTQLGNHAATKGVIVQADLGNSVNVRVGDSNVSTSQGLQLAPGDSSPLLPVDNANRIYVIGESGSPVVRYVVL